MDNDRRIDEVNRTLENMGRSIGTRLVDEFFAKLSFNAMNSCLNNFKEMMDAVAKVGFKMFLGAAAETINWDENLSRCQVVMRKY